MGYPAPTRWRAAMWKWSGGSVTASYATITAVIILLDWSWVAIFRSAAVAALWLEQHEKLAGWFQGVVAAGAVVGVYYVARYQTSADEKRSREDKRTRTREKYLAIAQSLYSVVALYRITGQDLRSQEGPSWIALHGEYEQAMALFDVFGSRPFDLPEVNLVGKLLQLKMSMRLTRILLKSEEANSTEASVKVMSARCKKMEAEVVEVIEDCLKKAKQLDA